MMIRGRGLIAFGLLAIGALASDATAQAGKPKPRLTPAPEWILPHDLDFQAAPDPELAPAGGVRYLLVDTQHHVGVGEQFIHRATRILNQQGVQDSGTLSIPFDPSYQTLLLHYVRLYRGQPGSGQPSPTVINQLTESAIKITQPETELSSDIYTGHLLATLFLADLRVGDVLEYAYTLRGSNPAMSGHYTAHFQVQYSRTVRALHIRVLVPATMHLYERYYRTALRPEVITKGSWLDYRWVSLDVPAMVLEDCLPIGFAPFSYIELSDFSSWREVRDWALRLYPEPTTELSAPMRSLIAKWQAEAETPEDRALAALRFVQEDIRYTGIELGEGSFRPTKPADTLARRFGDCKDKVYLLWAFLHAMDIKAYPALVSDFERKGVAKRLPSPLAFDHAVMRMTIDDRNAWVDPTMSHQGGTIHTAFIPDYGFALVMSPNADDLEPVPPCLITRPQATINELFTVKSFDQPVHLRVETEFLDHSAETMRADLVGADHEELANRYLNFYSRQFGTVRSVRPPVFTDDRVANRLTVIEQYEIEDLWKRDPDSNLYTVHFAPIDLQFVLTDPATRLRTMPLGIPYPLHLAHHTVIDLPEKWPKQSESSSVVHEAFALASKQVVSGTRVQLEYELRTLQREVQPDQVPTYLVRLKEAEDSLGDTITRPLNSGPRSVADIHWGMVALASAGAALVAAFGIWLCWTRRFRLPAGEPAPIPDEPRLQGLGGWLVVVGVGVVMSPFSMLYDFIDGAGSYFSRAVWNVIADPAGVTYHPLFAPGLVIKMLGDIVLIGGAVAACYLFFSKRRLFPKVYIMMMLLGGVMVVLDAELVSRIQPDPAQSADSSRMATLMRAFLGCAIWCPYMLRSRRVKSTFLQ